ncbi:MAG TPA: GNAT family N-acetyltransferase [Alphaproteobacteria bacterium]|nr:GNAT family N-acetyltransferase [Alphaproteobacteria bacterium]
MHRIRPARPAEAGAISALAIRAKAHWDYTEEQLAVFRGELTLAPDRIVPSRTHVIEEHGCLLGFYTLVARGEGEEGREGEAELEHVFVEPSAHGRGLGSALLRHACALARAEGFRALVIQSDPNAAGFYHAHGARAEGEIPSSIPGRSIPCFRLELEERADGEREAEEES